MGFWLRYLTYNMVVLCFDVPLRLLQGPVLQLLELHGLLDPARQDHHLETRQRHQEEHQTLSSAVNRIPVRLAAEK